MRTTASLTPHLAKVAESMQSLEAIRSTGRGSLATMLDRARTDTQTLRHAMSDVSMPLDVRTHAADSLVTAHRAADRVLTETGMGLGETRALIDNAAAHMREAVRTLSR